MAIRPSAVLADIVTQVEACAPFDDSEYARRQGPDEGFKFSLGSEDELSGERGFLLRVEQPPQRVEEKTLCDERSMVLVLVVNYGGLNSDAQRRMVDDSEALEAMLWALPTNVASILTVDVAAEHPLEEQRDKSRMRLQIPFMVVYSRS